MGLRAFFIYQFQLGKEVVTMQLPISELDDGQINILFWIAASPVKVRC